MSDQSKKLILDGTEIVCPRAGGRYVLIDLREISGYEARLDDVAIVTKQKAPELLSIYNRAYLEVSKTATTLENDLAGAERHQGEVRSRIVLDDAPRILKEKGLVSAKSPAGSEDLRTAVLEGNSEYQDAVELCEQIRCVIALLRGKQKAFENAYTAVKKIMGEDAFDHHPNPRFSGESGPAPVGGTNLEMYCATCFAKQFLGANGPTCANGHALAQGLTFEQAQQRKKPAVSGWGTPKY